MPTAIEGDGGWVWVMEGDGWKRVDPATAAPPIPWHASPRAMAAGKTSSALRAFVEAASAVPSHDPTDEDWTVRVWYCRWHPTPGGYVLKPGKPPSPKGITKCHVCGGVRHITECSDTDLRVKPPK